LHERFGVKAAAGGKHVGVGTHNALLALGPRTYLEVIAPDPDQPDPPTPRPFGLDALSAPKLTAWAVGCDDIEVALNRARARGYDPGAAVEMTRTTPDGHTLRWRLTTNAVGGGPVPFLIDWGDTPHPSRSAPAGLELTRFEIEDPDPESLTPILHAVGADVTVTSRSTPGLVAEVRSPNGTHALR
jgi:hypothetical protein